MDYLQFKELYHHGIKGQKWGIRRYQNSDGTLTEEGLNRYTEDISKMSYEDKRRSYKQDKKDHDNFGIPKHYELSDKNKKKISDLESKIGDLDKRITDEARKCGIEKGDKITEDKFSAYLRYDDGWSEIIDARNSGHDVSNLERAMTDRDSIDEEIFKIKNTDTWNKLSQAYGKKVMDEVDKEEAKNKKTATAIIATVGSVALLGIFAYGLKGKK